MDFLLRLSEPWAYILVALLAAGEGALLLGLVLPGEAAMLVAGVLVSQGRAALWVMVACAAAGGVLGDSLGYWAGRRLGPRLRSGRLGSRVGRDRWARANEYLRARGGRAIFLSRFVGFLRALMPVIAGQAGFPYPRFLLYNAPAAILWGAGFVLLGAAAGSSWHVVSRWLGRAGMLLVALAVVAVCGVLATRWVAAHLDYLRARRNELMARPGARRVLSRWRRQIDFVKRRLDPGRQFGLYLTVGLALSVLGAWLFGAVVEDVLARNELALFDRPLLEFLVEHREAYLTRPMLVLASLGHPPVTAAAFTVLAVWSYASTRQSRWPAFAAADLIGALAIQAIVSALVRRMPPDGYALAEVASSSFPSGQTSAAAALLSAAAFVATRRLSWRSAAWLWATALFVTFLVGVSRVYLGTCWPTDAIAGLVLGGFWTTVVATATGAWPRSAGGSGSVGWG